MKRNIKIISGLCAVILLLINVLGVGVSATSTKDISCKNGDKAYAIYLYNVTDNVALFEKNIDKAISPASTVKMMTALVAIDILGNVDKEITITKDMINGIETNTVGLQVGETVTLKSLLVALVCGGYNDAAQALAVASSGTVSLFVKRMNEKAAELGATNTVYKEPTGIDDSAQTTALDTALIAEHFLNNELLVEYSSFPSYKLPATNKSEEKLIYNRNSLKSSRNTSKYLNGAAIGMNAGMTSGGGYCVVTGVKNGGKTYVCVVMGAKHGAETDTTYSYAIANELIGQITVLDTRPILSSADIVGTLPIKGASLQKDTVELRPSANLDGYLPKDYESSELLDITYVYSVSEVVAPVKDGDAVGKIIVTYEGDIVGVCDLVVAEDVEREPIIYALYMIKDFLTSRTFILIVLSFIALLILKLTVIDRAKQKKKRYNKRYN